MIIEKRLMSPAFLQLSIEKKPKLWSFCGMGSPKSFSLHNIVNVPYMAFGTIN